MNKPRHTLILLLGASLCISSMERDEKVIVKWPLKDAQRSLLLSPHIVYENEELVDVLPITLPKAAWATRKSAQVVHDIVALWPELPVIHDAQAVQQKIIAARGAIEATNEVYSRDKKRLEAKIALLELRKQKIPEQKRAGFEAKRLMRTLEKLENDTEDELVLCITKEQNNLAKIAQGNDHVLKELEQKIVCLEDQMNSRTTDLSIEQTEKILSIAQSLSCVELIKAATLSDFLQVNGAVTEVLIQGARMKKITVKNLLYSKKLSLPPLYIKAMARTFFRPQLANEYKGAASVVAWSVDGKRIASAGFCDCNVIVRDPHSGQKICSLYTKGEISAIAWNPIKRDRLAIATPKELRVVNTTTGIVERIVDVEVLGVEYCMHSITWSPNGRDIVIEDLFKLCLGDVDTIKERIPSYDKASLRNLALSPDGQEIALIKDNTIIILNTDTQTVQRSFDCDESPFSIAWSPDGKNIAYSGGSNVVICESFTGNRVCAIKQPYTQIAWSPAGTYVYSTSANTINVWNAQTGESIHELTYTSDTSLYFRSAEWSFDERYISCGAGKESFCVWDVQTGKLLYSAETGGWIRSVVWSPKEPLFALSGAQGATRLFTLPTAKEVKTIENLLRQDEGNQNPMPIKSQTLDAKSSLEEID